MSGVPRNSTFHQRRADFCAKFPNIKFLYTDAGFDLPGRRFLYKHGMESRAAAKNWVWKWDGLKRLREFARKHKDGRVVLEVTKKPSGEHRWFIVPAAELAEKTARNKECFAVPGEDGYHAPRPLAVFIKSNAYDLASLQREFEKSS